MRRERQPIILDEKYDDTLIHRSWDDFGEVPPKGPAVRVPLCYGYFVGHHDYKNMWWDEPITCLRCLVMNHRTAVTKAAPP